MRSSTPAASIPPLTSTPANIFFSYLFVTLNQKADDAIEMLSEGERFFRRRDTFPSFVFLDSLKRAPHCFL